MIDLSSLNEQQREAVTHGDGPLLVLAGAGSGKTRAITYRIAHLVQARGVKPWNVLAVTFTNKAAGEMTGRVLSLVPNIEGKLMIGTFHSTSLRVLRRHADKIGYSRSFAIYDTADQMSLVKRVAKDLGFDDTAFPPRRFLSAISHAKNQLITPDEFRRTNLDFYGVRVATIYDEYQKRLLKFDAMDFDDLIGNYVRLLQSNDQVRRELNDRVEHLLVDEYQDTNHAQYVLIRLLAGEKMQIAVVGDEDQSIYKFRGADLNNILDFEQDFPGARIVKLEQNYRSSGNILDAATGVVSHNEARKGKKLFTDAGAGEPVRIVTCETERDEAKYVLESIRKLRHDGVPLGEMAVLFRTNAQSRPFEEELLNANIPYSVVGGTKFYERAEIKDLIAYLRLIARPNDDPALERVINVPARGIGTTTLRTLAERASELDGSIWSVIEGDLSWLSPRAQKSLGEFRRIVHDLQAARSRPLDECLELLLDKTGYRRLYENSRDPQDEARLENIEELVNSIREFYESNEDATIEAYLDSVSLLSDVDQYDSEEGAVLMTLHSAKGLEFRVVFLAGLEDGILPHSQSAEDIEEERRLCYVGMTRARERLDCLHCHQRRIHGRLHEQSPSPFLEEIPPAVTTEVNRTTSWRNEPRWSSRAEQSYRDAPDSAGNIGSFFSNAPVRFDPSSVQVAKPKGDRSVLKRGSRVRHESFGTGVVLQTEGSGDSTKLTVLFDRAGKKKFVAKYAPLTKI